MTGRARKIRLTDAGVARLRPRKTEYVVWDSAVKLSPPSTTRTWAKPDQARRKW